MAVNDLTRKLVERCRKGEGPFFMELMTYRYHGHHVGDINREYYRSKDEEKDWKENKDPIIRFRAYLVSEGIATEEEIEAMNAEIEADATEAVAYARRRHIPPVRGRHARFRGLRRDTMREITLSQAVNEALAEEMRRDETVFILGEDVAEAGTPFKVLSGLVEEFGTDRVIDTPISEPGFVGIAVGAAMTGARPVVDLMFGDFIYLVMDQLCNQAAKTALHVGRQADRADGAAHQSGRDPPLRRAAFAVAAGAGGAYSGPEGGAAVIRLRGQGADEDRDPRQQPGRDLRRQADVPGQGAGAGGGIPDPLRRGECEARGLATSR
jgi:hypothetical protein